MFKPEWVIENNKDFYDKQLKGDWLASPLGQLA